MKQLEFAIYFRSKFAVKKQLRYFQPTGAIMWLHTGIKVTTWRPLAYSYIVFLCSFCVLQFSLHNYKSFIMGAFGGSIWSDIWQRPQTIFPSCLERKYKRSDHEMDYQGGDTVNFLIC